MDIETDRLTLRLVPLAGLAATAAHDRKACARIIGKIPEEWFEDSWVAQMRLDQWKDDPDYAPWSIRAIILKRTADVVGYMNCHDRPNPIRYRGSDGLSVELGYSVFPVWQRQGFAHEAITGFAGWAAGRSVFRFVLSISPNNAASKALALKLGAEQIGSQIDEKDGPEDIYLFEIR